MLTIDAIPLYDFTGAVVTTVISIIVAFGIIAGLIFYVMRSKKRKKMVHNREKQNDNPEKMR